MGFFSSQLINTISVYKMSEFYGIFEKRGQAPSQDLPLYNSILQIGCMTDTN